MSYLYSNISKAVALRANQLSDASTSAAFETAFGGPINVNMDGMEIPYTALKMQVLASARRIAAFCGRGKNPILKAGLYARTADLVSGDFLPHEDETDITDQYLGDFGNVLDTDTELPLTEKPKQDIIRMNRLISTGFMKIVPYHFCFEDFRIYHTRPVGVFLEVCSWSDAVQGPLYDADGLCPLAHELEIMHIADVLANFVEEDWFSQEASVYAGIVQKCEQDIIAGNLPAAVLPDRTAGANPVKD